MRLPSSEESGAPGAEPGAGESVIPASNIPSYVHPSSEIASVPLEGAGLAARSPVGLDHLVDVLLVHGEPSQRRRYSAAFSGP